MPGESRPGCGIRGVEPSRASEGNRASRAMHPTDSIPFWAGPTTIVDRKSEETRDGVQLLVDRIRRSQEAVDHGKDQEIGTQMVTVQGSMETSGRQKDCLGRGC